MEPAFSTGQHHHQWRHDRRQWHVDTASTFNTLNGVTIASGATVEVTDGAVLDLLGAISGGGTIALGASGDFTGLEISGVLTLGSGGNVTMTDDAHNFIASNGSAATLTNFDTISGAGTIGDIHLTLVNSGTIDATGTHALTINTGLDNSFTAAGLVGNILVTNNHGGVLEAAAGHTLQIDDNVLNNGTIEADSSGVNARALWISPETSRSRRKRVDRYCQSRHIRDRRLGIFRRDH